MAMRESCTKYLTQGLTAPGRPIRPIVPFSLANHQLWILAPRVAKKAATVYQRGPFFKCARIIAAAVRPALDGYQLTLQLEGIVRTGPVH